MRDEDKAVVKALVPMAWADGVYQDAEKELIAALLDAFEANNDEKAEIKAYAEVPRKLEDIDVAALADSDRRAVLQHATFLSFVNGQQGPAEKELLGKLVPHLGVPGDEARQIMDAAAERAKKFLNLL